MKRNIFGYIIVVALLLPIIILDKACTKWKYSDYKGALESFEAKDGQYHVCVTNQVGGETLKLEVRLSQGETLMRSIGLVENVACLSREIPVVNNPLTYGKEIWELMKVMTNKDIKNVYWKITHNHKSIPLNSGTLEIK